MEQVKLNATARIQQVKASTPVQATDESAAGLVLSKLAPILGKKFKTSEHRSARAEEQTVEWTGKGWEASLTLVPGTNLSFRFEAPYSRTDSVIISQDFTWRDKANKILAEIAKSAAFQVKHYGQEMPKDISKLVEKLSHIH